MATLRRPPSSIACRKAMPSCNRCAGLCTTVARLDLACGCASGTALYGQLVSSGLVDVGLTAETATLLRAWHAKKIRAVLNCPAHLTHKSTSDLYRAHDIVDPVLKLQKRHANRVKRLLKRHRLSETGDVALASPALEQALFLRGQYALVPRYEVRPCMLALYFLGETSKVFRLVKTAKVFARKHRRCFR